MMNKIKQLELKLLNPSIRNSVYEIDKIISEDFREISKSGKTYTKKDVLDHLPKEESNREFKTSNWDFIELSEDIVLVNYISSESEDNFEQKTFRTSIWKKYDNNWKMIFHQGTKKSS